MRNSIRSIVETGIYVQDLDAAEQFYVNILGLAVIHREPDRSVFLQVGDHDVLLVFRAEATLQGGVLPAHGASGAGHFALGVEADSLKEWKSRLLDHEIEIEKEMDWPRGGKSIYFRDPADNSVELITPGVWGLPSGW